MKVHLVVEQSETDDDCYWVIDSFQEHLESKAKRVAKEYESERDSKVRVITIEPKRK